MRFRTDSEQKDCYSTRKHCASRVRSFAQQLGERQMLILTREVGEEIIITRDNHPILKLIQVSSQPKRRQRGSAKGQIWMAADFDEPLEDFKEYTESGSA